MPDSQEANIQTSSISQLRNSIYNILTNISELERAAQDNTASVANVDGLKQQTDEILKRLEHAPLEHYAKKLNKRKQLRIRKKLRLKQIKMCLKKKNTCHKSRAAHEKSAEDQTSASTSAVVTSALASSCAKTEKTKLHKRLRKHHDAHRFLRTFELLKMLHYTRSQDASSTREFAEQLNDLRATWSKVLEDNAPVCRREQQVEDQWNEVFFGATEHSYYGGEPPKTTDFLRVRRIWDSYLTRSKQGSSIPCGWVLPRDNAMADWQQYRATL